MILDNLTKNLQCTDDTQRFCNFLTVYKEIKLSEKKACLLHTYLIFQKIYLIFNLFSDSETSCIMVTFVHKVVKIHDCDICNKFSYGQTDEKKMV